MASSSDGLGDWGQEADLSPAATGLSPGTDSPPDPQQEPCRTPKSRSRNPSGDTPKSASNGKLESLPRDDLIKFVKKQMVLLQRTKAKCDELNKEVVALKADAPLANVEEQLKAMRAELGEVREERDNSMAGYMSAQQAQEATANQITAFEDEISKVTKENKVLLEQVECMTMKDETMTSSFMALQAELDKLESDKKAVEKEARIQKEARDQALTALHDLKGQTANESTSADEMKVELKDQRAQCSQLKDVVTALQAEKSKLESEHDLLVSNTKASDVKITDLLEQLKVSSSQCEQLKGDLGQSQQSQADLEKNIEALRTELSRDGALKSSESNLKAQLELLRSGQEANEQALQEQLTQCKDTLTDYQGQVEPLQQQNETQQKLLATTTAKVDELLVENTQLRSESQQIKAQLEEVKDELLTSRAAEENLQQEAVEKGAQLQRLDTQCTNLRSEVEEAGQLMEQLRADVQEYVKAIELVNKKLQQEEAANKALQESEGTTMARLEQLTGELKATHGQLRAASEKLNDWERLMAMLKDDRDRLEFEVMSLEDRESSSMTELDDLNSSLTEALQERDTLRDQMCRLTEHGGITASINTLKQTLEDLKFERDELNEKVTSLQEQNEQLARDTELLNSENELQAKELQVLKEKEQQMMQENCQRDTDHKKLLIEKDTLLSELMEKDSGVAHNAVELAELRAKVQNFDAEHEMILVRVEEFKRQAEIAQEGLIKAKRELGDSQMQIESFLPERQMLEQKLVDLAARRHQADVVHEENGRLKAEMENLTEVKDQQEMLQQEVVTQRAMVDRLQELLQTAEEQKHVITQEFEVLRKSNEAATESTQSVEAERDHISKAIQDLRFDLQSKSDKVQLLENELHSVQSNLEKIKQQNSEISSSQLDQESVMKEKVDQLQLSISQKCMLQQQLEAQHSDAEKLVSSLQILLSDKESEMSVVQTQHDGLIQQCLELQTDLEQSNSKCNSLETSVYESQEKLKATEDELNELREERVVISGELNKLKDLVKGMEKGSDSVAQESVNVKQEMAGLQAEKDGLKEQLVELEAGKIELVEQLQQANQDVSQLKTDKFNVEEEMTMLKKEQGEVLEENVRSEMEQSSRLHNEMRAVKETLEMKVRDLEAEVHESTSQLSAIQTELGQVKSNEDQLQLKLQEEVSQANMLKDQLKVVQNEKAPLLSNQQESTEKISELQEEIHQGNQKVASLECTIQNMRASADALVKELADMKDNYEEMVSEGNKMKEELSSRVQLLEKAQQELSGKEVEISELRQAAKSAEVMQQSTASQENDKVNKLQKDLKEANDKMNKFKQLALKAKKESNELKSKLDKISCELESVQRERGEVALNCQQLQAALDLSDVATEEANVSIQKKTDEVEVMQKERSVLKESLRTAEATCEELNRQLAATSQRREEVDAERGKVAQELEAVRIQRDQFIKDKEQLEVDVTQLQEQMKRSESDHGAIVKALQTELTDLHGKLSNAQKEAQQSSMMDLEIADYERTVQTLNEQMAERDARIRTTQAEVTRQEEKVTALTKQLESSEAQSAAAEERASKLKHLLVKSKKDLADAKRIESEQRAADAHLQGKLEIFNQQAEEQKIQIAGLVTENAKLVEKMRGSTDSNLRSLRSLELKVASLQGDLDLTKTELDTVQTEYDSYKIRVHHVLRQQKERGPNDASQQMDKQERERLEDAIDQLRSKVQDLSQQLTVAVSDNDVLQEEQDRLQARHTRLLQDLTNQEAAWKGRLDRATADRSATYKQHDDTVRQLTIQNETLTKTFKEQMRSMQEEHRRAVDVLQIQVERAASQAMSARPDTPVAKSPTHGESDPDMDSCHRVRTEERQAAEGMELPEPEACKRTLMISPPSLIPLEQLLNSPPTSPEPMSLAMMDDSLLRNNLATAQQRIEHLTGLMNESEATVLRLTEQARVLKEEIRRQERNMERNQHVEKAEYLKNIILKFLTLETEDERKQLIPVLVTMLRLSPDEKNMLMFIARGGKEDENKEATGWSGYLHRWSGLI